MSVLSLDDNSPSMPQESNEKRQSLPSLEGLTLAPIHGMEISLKSLAEASNITLEALEAAIIMRQQQLLQRQQGTTSTTTTTTQSPVKK